jgi:hypothetical protein
MEERPSKLARQILRYLASHPDARDTVRGIAEWWLMQETIERNVCAVRAALRELVAAELVIEQPGSANGECYRLNRERTAEVERIVAEGSNG